MPSVDEGLAELESTFEVLWQLAQEQGLDPFPVHFELVPAPILYEFGAYGLPGRFHHWTHGKAYQMMKTHYDFGLNKIYELVINANPSQAFLLDSNTPIANKMVMAHVLAHVDFFKNNAYFATTPRDMIERASNNAARLRRYEFEHGRREVEELLDAVLSIEEHVDPLPERKSLHRARRAAAGPGTAPEGERPLTDLYDDLFPQAERRRAGKRGEEGPGEGSVVHEGHDLLLFLARHAPHLEDWERDVIEIVRQERLYFAPQIQTKIMNEGWASFWHVRLMRQLPLGDAEYADFARLHAALLAPYGTGINPYRIGHRIFEDLAARHGLDFAFEVRCREDDVSFLRNYLTRELCTDLDLYLFRYTDEEWRVVEKDWEMIREAIVLSRVHGGHPVILVEDGDYHGNRELYLRHSYDGRELDLEYAERTLERVARIWRRRVHLETVMEGQRRLLIADAPKG